jgi:hypothetical protein
VSVDLSEGQFMRDGESKGSIGRISAAARHDCFCFVVVSAVLYGCFGALHKQGTPPYGLAAALFFSPLLGGVILGLRGHVVPFVIHVTCGVSNALAAILPLTVIRPGSGALQRLSWLGVGQVVSILGLVALMAGLSSLAGTEFGGIVERLRREKAMEQRSVARARSRRSTKSRRDWVGPIGPILVALITASAAIVVAAIAKG